MTEVLGPLVTFAVATSITPGPNNIMLTASGANFGFRRTLPHLLGVAIGFTFMVLAIGLGLSEIFERLPVIHQVLRYGGAAYLLYLAYASPRPRRRHPTRHSRSGGRSPSCRPRSFNGSTRRAG